MRDQGPDDGAGSRGSTRGCLLLVSQDASFLELYGAVLRIMGFAVTAEDTAEAAVAVAREARLDCAITDYPVLAASGQTPAELLRHHPTTANLPVLCVTAWVMDAEIAAAYERGAARVLAMPATPLALVEAVERILEERSADEPPR